MAFEETAADLKQRVERLMHSSTEGMAAQEEKLANAISYAVNTDGKRIRPLLVYAVAELESVSAEIADYPAAAIELIHTYSLIHDDLPAMDDDDLRRGQPTLHKAFDEATAILVGDALLTRAFGLLTEAPVDAEIILRWVKELSHSAGAEGMILGQAVDLVGEERSLELEELSMMHRKKSGALIEASLRLMPQLTGNQSLEEEMTAFGHHLGLAFQIRDDLLDVEASTETLGKPRGSDVLNNKSTYVSLLGLEAARVRMEEELIAARELIAGFGERGRLLGAVSEFIVDRDF